MPRAFFLAYCICHGLSTATSGLEERIHALSDLSLFFIELWTRWQSNGLEDEVAEFDLLLQEHPRI